MYYIWSLWISLEACNLVLCAVSSGPRRLNRFPHQAFFWWGEWLPTTLLVGVKNIKHNGETRIHNYLYMISLGGTFLWLILYMSFCFCFPLKKFLVPHILRPWYSNHPSLESHLCCLLFLFTSVRKFPRFTGHSEEFLRYNNDQVFVTKVILQIAKHRPFNLERDGLR